MSRKYSQIFLYLLTFILTLILTFIFIIAIISYYKKQKYENFSIEFKMEDYNKNKTFTKAIENNQNLKIINIASSINYNNSNITAFIGDIISYKILNKLDNKIYIIIRYPDFRNEIKRHSYDYIHNYFIFLKTIIKNNNNYILDFTGFHGILDNKVRLWIQLYTKYGRNIANEIMGTTYLCPNDKQLFLEEYKTNKKYILKNSFGGARTALTVTKSKNEILNHFNNNLLQNFNPITCIDAVCHSKVKYNIIQDFIEPTFLMKGYKFGLRMFLVIIKNNSELKYYIFKDGICYYSEKKYNNLSTNLNNNVVGIHSKLVNEIQNHRLPITFKDFEKYSIQNEKNGKNKINYFISKIKKYCKYIIESNKNELCIFQNKNIKCYSIFAMDIEIDKNYKPYIFEANYYFSRRENDNIIHKIITNMYNDIYHKIGLSTEEFDGLWEL